MSQRLLAALVVAALVTTPLAGVAAGAGGADPAFEQSVYSVDRGETAAIVIDTTGTDDDSARLTVGDAADVNFEAAATVIDADGDGTVTVRFDTGAAHESSPASYLTAAGGDELKNRTERAGVDEPLDPASYPLSLGDPDDPAASASLALLAGHETETPSDDGATTTQATPNGTTLDTTDGDVVVQRSAQQSISGETTVDAGTSLSIRVQSSSSESPFLMQVETTVAEDGTFEGSFDFSDVATGTEFEVTVRGDGATLAQAPGRVADCEAGCPTVTSTPDSADDEATPLDTDQVAVQDITRVAQTEAARIPISFGDAEAVTITIGDGDAINYETSAVVRDTDGDGRAFLIFRTNATDNADRPALAVEENGETRPVNVTSETTLDTVLDPAPYSIDVFGGPTREGNPADIGTLVVQAAGDTGTDQPLDGDSSVVADGSTAEPPASPDAGTVAASNQSGSFLTGIGALALGGLLAFGAIAMFLGFVRS